MLIIYIYHVYIWVCLEMPHAVQDVCLEGMIRGYDSGYDSWTWFVGMIRGPWFSVSPHPPCMVIYPHLPPKCFKCWWLYHTWSALELACCCRCACCCQSGVCALEPAWWCRWSAAARCWCRVLLAVRVVCTVWGGMLVALRVLLQVLPEGDAELFQPCFGAGMLVSGCRWKVLLEGAVELPCWCCCKGGAWGCCREGT